MWSVGEAERSIQVLMHHHLAPCQRAAPAHFLDLQRQILKAHRVVALHGALELERKNPIQIRAPARYKGVSPLCRRNLKTADRVIAHGANLQ